MEEFTMALRTSIFVLALALVSQTGAVKG